MIKGQHHDPACARFAEEVNFLELTHHRRWHIIGTHNRVRVTIKGDHGGLQGSLIRAELLDHLAVAPVYPIKLANCYSTWNPIMGQRV
jgi:hypothetical protein